MEYMLLNAGHPELEGHGQYAREQGYYPEGPRLAGGMSQQEPHEIQRGQMQSPALRKEQPLATVQAGTCLSGE